MKNPFAANTPSVFVVCSPFQILCAMAAIRQLDIIDYKILVIISDDNARKNQVLNILEKSGLSYELDTCMSRYRFWFYAVRALIPRRNKYHRLFIGDFRDVWEHFAGCGLVSTGADIVYLDDGLGTVGLLNNKKVEVMKGKHLLFFKIISFIRNFEFFKNLLTIYDRISNHKYIIEPLSLELVVNKDKKDKTLLKDVFIVGTNIESFCPFLEIPENSFVKKLGVIMNDIHNQYPHERVVYIPHGREKKEYAEILCQQYNCFFHRPEMMIELELLNLSYIPKVIYGFTSAALYTLKKLFPSTRVVNILFNLRDGNPYYEVYKVSSEYYLQNGIELRKEDIDL